MEGEQGPTGKERLKRLLVVIVAATVTYLAASVILGKIGKVGGTMKLPDFSTTKVGELAKSLGGMVLGKASGILPNRLTENSSATDSASQTQIETSPEKIIQEETKKIIEIIKKLPEEQIKKIKKQVFQSFCDEVLKE